ncbi:MAG TPA: DUF2520 domain-containing protein [Gemmatimonadales bacterium]|jgi:predicted short-subunit dehydrogenase-like oxidoreductase (DUF2520 family)
MTGFRTAIVGAGRMGQGIGLGLVAAGWDVLVLARTARPVSPGLEVAVGALTADAVRDRPLVLVATPDDAIAQAAEALAASGGVGRDHVVLHLSGLLDRAALAALERTGAALGSFHPLQSVAESAGAPAQLRGAFAGIEGDPRALAAGQRVAAALGMTAVPIDSAAKPAYHAGAVLAANYTTALVGVAARLAEAAGVPPETAARMYVPLVAGAAANLVDLGAAQALTGPIRRGDTGTIRAHLAALPAELRPLYRILGRQALKLAREAGLSDSSASAVMDVLEGDDPGGGEG